MKQMKILKLLFVIMLFASCKSQHETDERNWPKKLTIGFTINDNFTDYNRLRGMIADYLEEQLQIDEITLEISSDYAAVIEAMKSKKVDIAHFGELSYLIANERAGAEAIVRYETTDSIQRITYSVMIVHPESGLNTVEDVIEKAGSLILAFADPASTSGHLFPRHFLNSRGLDPEEDFKEVIFTNSHTASIFGVQAKSADVAFTYYLAPERLLKKDKIKAKDFKIIWESEPYITAPISVRSDLPVDLKKAIQQAYANIHINAPEMWNTYKEGILSFYSKEKRDKIIYIETHDSCYNGIREVIKNTDKFNIYE
jgi:phosphonate transport system substrate-binding protein